MSTRASLLAVLLAFGAIASARQGSIGTIAIVDAVIPMTSNTTVLSNHTILVSGDRISAVLPASKISVPKDALRIDGRGKFVIPGLADVHVHLEYFEQPDILGLFVANGVTTVRNMDGRPNILDWRKRAAAGQLAAPRIYSAGPLLDGSPPVRPDTTVVSSAAEAGERNPIHRTPGRYASAIEADISPFKGKGHWSKGYLSSPIDNARLATLAEHQAKSGVWSVPTLVQPLRELLRVDEINSRLAADEVRYIPVSGREQWREMATRIAKRMDDADWTLMADGVRHRRQVVSAFRRARPLGVGGRPPRDARRYRAHKPMTSRSR